MSLGKLSRQYKKAQFLFPSIFTRQNVVFIIYLAKSLFRYDKVYFGTPMYVLRGVARRGGGERVRGCGGGCSENIVFSSHNAFKTLQTSVTLHVIHIICFDTEARVPNYLVLGEILTRP